MPHPLSCSPTASLPPCLPASLLCCCSVADTFYDKLKQRAQSINIGDPLQPGCRMGPVVSASQYERVRGYVQVGSCGVGWGILVCGADVCAVTDCLL